MIVKHGFYSMFSITYKASFGCISSISDMKWLFSGNVLNKIMAYLLGFGYRGVALQRQEGRYTPAISVILLEFLESLANIF